MRFSRFTQPLAKFAIASFCLYHMAAIGLWCIPDRDPRQWLQDLRLGSEPYTRAYLLSTSQWQNWGLFSQGSLERVMTSRIDVWKDGKWTPKKDLSFAALPWWQNEAETSMLRSFDGNDRWPVRERYLQRKCIQLRMASGTYLHFANPYYDPPMPERTANYQWWSQWEPDWTVWEDTWYTRCQTPDWVDPLPL